MQCGRASFGRPSMGSWLTYGLGSESRNLPGYVVLTAGRGTSGGASLWPSGFLPTTYPGVLFRNQGEPVLNLQTRPACPAQLQRKGLDALARRERRRASRPVRDPEIASRIASYELAFRMQSAGAGADRSVGRDAANARHVRRRSRGARTSRPTAAAGRASSARSPPTACWPGGWSSAACASSTSSTPRGTITRTSTPSCRSTPGWPISRSPRLIKDLKQRGLLDETLVVWGSEFGRTPLGENRGGSEMRHRPRPSSVRLQHLDGRRRHQGRPGHGETDEIGWAPVEDPVHVNDLHATLLHLFGIDHLRLTYRFQGRDFRLTDVGGKVVDAWLA